MNRTQKEELVASIRSDLENAKSVILANHTGIDVNTVNELRAEFRANDVKYRVVKNTLAKIAIRDTELEEIAEMFKGPTAIAYSEEDAVSPAKVIKDFAEEHDEYEVRGGFLDGDQLDMAGVEQLADMPTKDEMRAQFLRLLEAAPTKLLRVFKAAQNDFVQVLGARKRDLD